MAFSFGMERSVDRTQADYSLPISVAMLAVLGLANLYSASYGYALALGRPAGYFAMRQALYFMPPSLLLFLFCAYVPEPLVRRLIGPAVLFCLALLALPFVPGIGITRNGASRWIGFGPMMFQPSELFKPLLIVYLAHILSKKADRLGDIINSVLPPLLVCAAGIGLVLLQNDFSTAMMLVLISVVMFWVAEVPLVFFAALGSIGLPLISLAVLTSDYRLKRVLGFLAPNFDPADISYQVHGSLRAIRSGGLTGKGIGQGSLKLRSIPEVHSDFVFAAWVEESGFVGVLVFIALWAFFLWRVFSTALRATDPYLSLLVFGMGAYLAMQTLMNIAVVVGLVPATGMPLPFFSAGGSSLLSVAIASGFIFQGSLRSRRREAAPEAAPEAASEAAAYV